MKNKKMFKVKYGDRVRINTDRTSLPLGSEGRVDRILLINRMFPIRVTFSRFSGDYNVYFKDSELEKIL